MTTTADPWTTAVWRSNLVDSDQVPTAAALEALIAERRAALDRDIGTSGAPRRNAVNRKLQRELGQLLAMRDMRSSLDRSGNDVGVLYDDIMYEWANAGRALEIRDDRKMRARLQHKDKGGLRRDLAQTGLATEPLEVLKAYEAALAEVIQTGEIAPHISAMFARTKPRAQGLAGYSDAREPGETHPDGYTVTEIPEDAMWITPGGQYATVLPGQEREHFEMAITILGMTPDEDYSGGIVELEDAGWIRLRDGNSVEFRVAPTAAQLRTIRHLFTDMGRITRGTAIRPTFWYDAPWGNGVVGSYREFAALLREHYEHIGAQHVRAEVVGGATLVRVAPEDARFLTRDGEFVGEPGKTRDMLGLTEHWELASKMLGCMLPGDEQWHTTIQSRDLNAAITDVARQGYLRVNIDRLNVWVDVRAPVTRHQIAPLKRLMRDRGLVYDVPGRKPWSAHVVTFEDFVDDLRQAGYLDESQGQRVRGQRRRRDDARPYADRSIDPAVATTDDPRKAMFIAPDGHFVTGGLADSGEHRDAALLLLTGYNDHEHVARDMIAAGVIQDWGGDDEDYAHRDEAMGAGGEHAIAELSHRGYHRVLVDFDDNLNIQIAGPVTTAQLAVLRRHARTQRLVYDITGGRLPAPRGRMLPLAADFELFERDLREAGYAPAGRGQVLDRGASEYEGKRRETRHRDMDDARRQYRKRTADPPNTTPLWRNVHELATRLRPPEGHGPTDYQPDPLWVENALEEIRFDASHMTPAQVSTQLRRMLDKAKLEEGKAVDEAAEAIKGEQRLRYGSDDPLPTRDDVIDRDMRKRIGYGARGARENAIAWRAERQAVEMAQQHLRDKGLAQPQRARVRAETVRTLAVVPATDSPLDRKQVRQGGMLALLQGS